MIAKPIYWNSKQISWLKEQRPYMMFLGGRGTGKTTSEAGYQYLSMRSMPRSLGALVSSTYAQLLNTTLPGITAKFAEMNLTEGVDYVIGRKPPAFFERSFKEPEKYQYVLSYRNGRRVLLMSMDQPDTMRGGSYTDIAVDEAALVPEEHIQRVLVPMLRGYANTFDTPINGVLRCYTSIPWKPKGLWVLNYEEKAISNPEMYRFVESTTADNVAVLGHDYLQRLEAELPYLEYCMEVLNMRVKRGKDPFYHNFDADKHSYTPQYVYDFGEVTFGGKVSGLTDRYYNPDAVVDVSFDFSGYFNCATIWQASKHLAGKTVEACLAQAYMTSEQGKVAELVKEIVRLLPNQKRKMVRLWGEPRGNDQRADGPTLYEQMKAIFQREGWSCEVKATSKQVMKHSERVLFTNEILAESNQRYPYVRINSELAKDFIIALQMTSLTPDNQKDKSIEKIRGADQRHAPHFTDTFDYYFEQKYGAGHRGSVLGASAYVR